MKNLLVLSILTLALVGVSCIRETPGSPMLASPAPTVTNQPRSVEVVHDSSRVPTSPPGSSRSGSVTPVPASTNATPTEPNAVSANLVLSMNNNRQSVTIKPGQVLELIPPFEYPSWKLEYDEQILALLRPKEKGSRVGLDGWLFQAKALGKTDLRLRTNPADCPKDIPCPRVLDVDFIVTIQVSP